MKHEETCETRNRIRMHPALPQTVETWSDLQLIRFDSDDLFVRVPSKGSMSDGEPSSQFEAAWKNCLQATTKVRKPLRSDKTLRLHFRPA